MVQSLAGMLIAMSRMLWSKRDLSIRPSTVMLLLASSLVWGSFWGAHSLVLSVAVVIIANDEPRRTDFGGQKDGSRSFDVANSLGWVLVTKDVVDRKLDLVKMHGVVDGKKALDNVSNKKRVFCTKPDPLLFIKKHSRWRGLDVKDFFLLSCLSRRCCQKSEDYEVDSRWTRKRKRGFHFVRL